jgi:nucleotide-binding universal stress UspA family protein
MKINNILVPYDGTESSKKAFNSALDLAKKHEAEILIFTCIPEQATFGLFKSKADKKAMQNQKNLAEKQIESLKHKAESAEVSITSKVMLTHRLPSECIVKYSSEKKIDLIVMSTRRTSPSARMHYISTVENVFKHAKCALLIVK